MIRVDVDDERCQGNGVCARLAPEVFELRPGGVTVRQEAPGPALEAAVRDAARRCPTRAVALSG
ncbi:MAG TPA: ferredoxin [Acidimicrobiales bacterium]|nr:ferredoxin [Acidimicrobiales bacterium]